MHPFHRHWILWLSLPGLAFLGGCGVAEYEQLVKARQQELTSTAGSGPVEWNEFQSATGFSIEWPGIPEPASDFQADATTEELSGSAGTVSFRAFFLQATNAEAGNLFNQSQEQLVAQGYTVADQSEDQVRGLRYQQLKATDAQGLQTIVRAYQLAPGSACVLTVTSEDPSDPQIAQFLDSVKPL